MELNTVTVVLEGPNGEERTLEGVRSLTTADDGTIHVEQSDQPDLQEVGWDWTVRDVYVAWDPDVTEGEWVTFVYDDRIQRGKVKHINGDEVTVKVLPDGWQMAVARDQIIPG